jgi:hypothetical protein
LAGRLNSLPKYVVSSSIEAPEWNNSTVLKGDVVDEVSKPKQARDQRQEADAPRRHPDPR